MGEVVMLCACGARMACMTYGWQRSCACKPTAGYWRNLAPLPADGVAFHQLTGQRIEKRAGMYRYGGPGS